MNRPQCPQCGVPVVSVRIGAVELASRAPFALVVTVGLLVFDLVLEALHGRGFELQYLWTILVAGSIRFVLAYSLMWPLALHARHRRPHEWRQALANAVLIPALVFMRTLIVEPLLGLLLR